MLSYSSTILYMYSQSEYVDQTWPQCILLLWHGLMNVFFVMCLLTKIRVFLYTYMYIYINICSLFIFTYTYQGFAVSLTIQILAHMHLNWNFERYSGIQDIFFQKQEEVYFSTNITYKYDKNALEVVVLVVFMWRTFRQKVTIVLNQ